MGVEQLSLSRAVNEHSRSKIVDLDATLKAAPPRHDFSAMPFRNWRLNATEPC
jgi:hypothetical protein